MNTNGEEKKFIPPVLDPLNDCADAISLYDHFESSTPAEKLILLMHIIHHREHRPNCPRQDPKLADRIRSDLGIDTLPD